MFDKEVGNEGISEFFGKAKDAAKTIEGISSIAALVPIGINLLFDIHNFMKTGKDQDISKNVIKVVTFVSDDLPLDVRNSYCHSLEVTYALQLKSLLEGSIRGNLNSSNDSLFKDIPLLTPHDKVVLKNGVNVMRNVSSGLFSMLEQNKNDSPIDAMSIFTENYNRYLDKLIVTTSSYGMENDVLIKEARGMVPTFVNLEIQMYDRNGKLFTAKRSIGIEVRPVVVPKEQFISFFIKKDKNLLKIDNDISSVWSNIKNKFKASFSRIEKDKNLDGIITNEIRRDLSSLMTTVSGITKPFVNILISDTIYNDLKENNIDLTSRAQVSKLFKFFPVMSFGIYYIYSDMIKSCLSRDGFFTTRTAADFNSEIAVYEKQLAEMVRHSNRM